MKNTERTIYNNFIQKKYLKNKGSKILRKKYDQIVKKININIDTQKDIFHSLSRNFKFNFKAEEIKKFKNFKTVVIIGMGGSVLGAEAIYSFLKKKIKKNFIFINDIDQNKLEKTKREINLNKALFIIISKSGNTIETFSNLLALKIIKNNNKYNNKNIIVISEKNNNPLYLLSKKMKLFHIEHKKFIGGRFSVLSEVGMLPATLMGINIIKFRKNLLIHLNLKKEKFLKESSLKLVNLFKANKFKNLILFNYVPELNKFLYWSQQLIAESLGKNNKGFLPVISSAPKDHHSLLQLYLDGSKDKLFYIFSLEANDKVKITSKTLDKKLIFLNNKTLAQIKKAQKNAFLHVLKKKEIPFREFKIRNLNEETLGELFSYFILETVIVGKLANINPFDQPAVEQVKVKTKELLS